MATYPFRKYNYTVVFGTLGEAEFSEISMCGDVINPFTLQTEESIYDGRHYGNVQMKLGTTNSTAVLQWLMQTAEELDPRTITISLCSYIHQKYVEWDLTSSVPVILRAPDSSMTGNDFTIDYLELACESIICRRNKKQE